MFGVTLDAKPPFSTAAQIEFKHCPGTRVVTGNAGHCFKVPGVQGLFTDRMRKLLMSFMALGTKLQRPFFKHHRDIRAVHLMTVTAGPFSGMMIKHLPAPF